MEDSLFLKLLILFFFMISSKIWPYPGHIFLLKSVLVTQLVSEVIYKLFNNTRAQKLNNWLKEPGYYHNSFIGILNKVFQVKIELRLCFSSSI